MAQPKQAWDTRAWRLGVIGGTVSGCFTAFSLYPSSQNWLNSLPHLARLGIDGEVISFFLGGVSTLVLPALLSGIAKRWTFIWGLLPLALFLITRDVETCIESGAREVYSNLWFSLLLMCLCLLLSSGPVSLIRWLRVRGKRRQAALLASHQAMREAASIPQEGAWPPPPDYTA